MTAVASNSDIEEATTKKGDGVATAASDKSSQTSKSATVRLSIDPTVLERLASTHDGDSDSRDSRERKADLFCGSCCDLRKACIVVNSVFVVLIVLYVVFSLLGHTPTFFRSTIDFDNYDDDDSNVTRGQPINASFVRAIIRTTCGILFCGIGIVGALRFQKYMVLSTAIWYCIDVILGVVYRGWTGVVVSAFFGYAHIALFLALHKSKITVENYSSTEKYCCWDSCFAADD